MTYGPPISGTPIPGGETPKNFAKSAARALDVLAYLAEHRAPARAKEIAEALGMAASSADQLLKSMVLSGYLIFRLADKAYAPSAKLRGLADWVTEIYPPDAKIEALLEELHAATGCTVTFSLEADGFMEVANYIRVPLYSRVQARARVPMLCSALGGSILAGRSDSYIRSALLHAWRQRTVTSATIRDLSANVFRSVDQFRRLGYAWRLRGAPCAPGDDVFSMAVGLRASGVGSGMALGLAGAERDVRPRQAQIAGVMHELAAKYDLAA